LGGSPVAGFVGGNAFPAGPRTGFVNAPSARSKPEKPEKKIAREFERRWLACAAGGPRAPGREGGEAQWGLVGNSKRKLRLRNFGARHRGDFSESSTLLTRPR